jgi:multidrug transporter EmrE-like cation transporter
MHRLADWSFILATILFTVYGQLILKWRLDHLPALPSEYASKFVALFLLVFDPWIFSGFFAAFLASLAWMAALTRFDISYAYPFMSMNFVLVLLLGAAWFGEPFTTPKVLGVIFIMAGTYVASKGM